MGDIKMLRELRPGEKGRVTKISGSGSVYRRILDMGLVKGAEVEMDAVMVLN